MTEKASIRLMVCGTRTFTGKWWYVAPLLDEFCMRIGTPEIVLFGDCKTGPDEMAHRWALARKLPFQKYEANWMEQGKAAGPIRNRRIAQEGRPTHCVALWDGASRGTLSAIREALAVDAVVTIFSTHSPFFAAEHD